MWVVQNTFLGHTLACSHIPESLIFQFWKKLKKNIDMAQNSTQIAGIAFSELKAEKKQQVNGNLGKWCFVKISVVNRHVM